MQKNSEFEYFQSFFVKIVLIKDDFNFIKSTALCEQVQVIKCEFIIFIAYKNVNWSCFYNLKANFINLTKKNAL